MSSIAKKFGKLEKQLQKLNITLDRLIEDVKQVQEASSKIDYATSLNYLKNLGEVLLTGTSPFYIIIQQFSTKEYKNVVKVFTDSDIFNVIAINNPSEDYISNHNILSVIIADSQKFGESIIPTIINLRFSAFPSFYDDTTVFIGNRYLHDTKGVLEKLFTKLENKGFTVLYDEKDFGGGPFVYQAINQFGPVPRVSIFEITVSEKLINMVDKLESIYKVFVTVM